MDEHERTPSTADTLHATLATAAPINAAEAAPPTEAYAVAASPQRRPGRTRVLAFAAAGALLLAIGAGGGALAANALRGAPNTTTALGGSSDVTTTRPDRFGGFGRFGGSADTGGTTSTSTSATAAQTVGVVTIDTKLGYADGAAAGTGIVLTSGGEILTNNHVIAGATTISVTVETTGRSYTAEVVGTDATDDIALLQLQDANGLQVASLASSPAAVGDTVTAVGNAGGTGDLTTVSGAVADLGQTITTQAEGSAASETLNGLIETDADVVAGDSGGPLTNSAGAVVGIDTAASSGSRQVQSYAIPIASALDIVRQIRTGTETDTITIGYPAFLGIEVDGTSTSSGATVAGVLEDTPAALAGLTAGDVITAADGRAVASGDGLTDVLQNYAAGDTVTITYTTSQGMTRSEQVTLIQGPAN